MKRGWKITLIATLLLAFSGGAALAAESVAEADRENSRYIVTLEKDVAPGEHAFGSASLLPGLDDVAREMALRYRGEVVHVYGVALHGFSIDLDPRQAALLEGDPRVESVVEDDPEGIELFEEKHTPSWCNDRVGQRGSSLNGKYEYDPRYTGQGVRVYVIDTGVDRHHPEFSGVRVHGGHSVFGGSADSDGHGHGTAVAGVVAGRKVGVASAAEIVPVRVVWQSRRDDQRRNPGRYVSNIIAGLNWAMKDVCPTIRHGQCEKHRWPAVFNMSIGYTGPSDKLKKKLNRAVLRAINDYRIPVVVAAGNRNRDARRYSPSTLGRAIVVGASGHASATDWRWAKSNYGPRIDLFAPGDDVLAPVAGTKGYDVKEGTSFGAAHVTGAVAIYLSRVGMRSPADVENRLEAHSTKGVVRNRKGSADRLLYSYGM